MMVGVGPCFYGFTLDSVREEAVLCHILSLFFNFFYYFFPGVTGTPCHHP